MKIKEVVKLTKLTKKAVRYYEEKGLISPKTDTTNGYKNYSEKDIADLEIIAFLRSLDMPVFRIKEYIFEEENRKILLEKHITQINKQIYKFHQIEETARLVLEKRDIDYHKLNEELKNKQAMNTDYVLKQLQVLFPGTLGKYLVVHYGAFLNEPLDSQEKINAFDDIISYLDEIDDVSFSNGILDTIRDIDEDELLSGMAQTDKKVFDNITDLDLNNPDEILALKNKINNHIKYQQKNYDFYKHQNIEKASFIEALKKQGFYDKFVGNLKILSKTYRDYLEKAKDLNSILNIDYDENGFIIKT